MSNNPYEPLSDSLLSNTDSETDDELETTEEVDKSEDNSDEKDRYISEGNPDRSDEEDEDNLEEISNGTVKDILEWVGEDQDRAEQMMTLEVGKGSKSRTSLIKALHEVLS